MSGTSDQVTIWHNPRCSKSRATLAILEAMNVEPVVVRYLENPPTVVEISRVLDLLGIAPRELMRGGEAAYTENNLDADDLDDDTLIAAMAAEPILIERPVVIRGQRARLGRPPERVRELFDEA